MGKKILMGLILMGAMSGPGLAWEDDGKDNLDAVEVELKETVAAYREMNETLDEMREEMIEMMEGTERKIMRLLCEKYPASGACDHDLAN